jgi:uncharacterized OsmC-like protein
MKISATVKNSLNTHQVSVQTNDTQKTMTIPPKSSGGGSSVNGGELLFLALATCYCNDLYREAAKREITIEKVEVSVVGDFTAEGAPLENITYQAQVAARASEEKIRQLIIDTDQIAEIQNTLRKPVTVELNQIETVSI